MHAFRAVHSLDDPGKRRFRPESRRRHWEIVVGSNIKHRRKHRQNALGWFIGTGMMSRMPCVGSNRLDRVFAGFGFDGDTGTVGYSEKKTPRSGGVKAEQHLGALLLCVG
jgi:hypothetical protein